MLKKYKPGDKLTCVRDLRIGYSKFISGNTYTIAPDNEGFDYGIVECYYSVYGWIQDLIEDPIFFKPYIINWKKRIQR